MKSTWPKVTCKHRGHSSGVHWLLTGGGPEECIKPQVAPPDGR